MGTDKVVGFGHQFIKALIPPPAEGPDSPAAQPGPRIMHPAARGDRAARNGPVAIEQMTCCEQRSMKQRNMLKRLANL
jgi:hypothetical protein